MRGWRKRGEGKKEDQRWITARDKMRGVRWGDKKRRGKEVWRRPKKQTNFSLLIRVDFFPPLLPLFLSCVRSKGVGCIYFISCTCILFFPELAFAFLKVGARWGRIERRRVKTKQGMKAGVKQFKRRERNDTKTIAHKHCQNCRFSNNGSLIGVIVWMLVLSRSHKKPIFSWFFFANEPRRTDLRQIFNGPSSYDIQHFWCALQYRMMWYPSSCSIFPRWFLILSVIPFPASPHT